MSSWKPGLSLSASSHGQRSGKTTERTMDEVISPGAGTHDARPDFGGPNRKQPSSSQEGRAGGQRQLWAVLRVGLSHPKSWGTWTHPLGLAKATVV